jgi:alpha-galactosidase
MRPLLSVLFIAGAPLAWGWRNGAALTPPMGFANWNLFGCNYDDAFFREIADAFVSTGLRDAGYEYMLVQECIVPKGARDPVTHVVIPDAAKFPHGLADLADYFHSKGLKAGIYTDVAHLTCADYEGSGPGGDHGPAPGYWPLDALTYAQWGFDMIEADFCNVGGPNATYTAFELYTMARDAIAAATAATGRTVALYQCNWGAEQPWEWAPEVANLFRNTGDICGPGRISFGSILSNFDNTVKNSGTPPRLPGLPGTGVGAWNDPDMIGVGMPGITDMEGRTQFSLWCILGAPLFLGTDVRNMSAFTAATVGNLEAIAINQGASMQGWEITLGSGGAAPSPTPDNGGLLMNLTSCDSGNAGLTWTFDAASGHLQSAASGDSQCVTVVACDNTNSSEVFVYQCVSNQCNNEVWKIQGSAIVSQVNGSAQPLCLTGVDPATAPRSQLIADVCDGRAAQQWTVDAASKTVRLAAFPAASQCLTLFAPPPVNSYMKTMDNGDVALALLNRGAADVAPISVDLTQFGYAPATPVYVRDVWAATTSGPFTGSFSSRAVASHETVLLRLMLAKPGSEAEL